MAEFATETISNTGSMASSSAGTQKKKDFDKRRLIKPLVWVGILVVIILIIAMMSGGGDSTADMAERTYLITRGDLPVNITGSGVMKPIDQRDIVPLISKGKILTAPFEEGDIVSEGALLYTFDSSSLENDIEKTKNSIATSEIDTRSGYETMNDWTITATASGRITNLKTAVGADYRNGDTINAGTKLCDITNDDVLRINIPFSESQKSGIYIGQSAQLSSAQYMTTDLYGKVTDINGTPIRGTDGTVLYNIEITLNNPGAISSGMEFTAIIDGMVSPASGAAEMSANDPVTSRATGKITNIYVSEGDYVTAGTIIMRLSNSSVTDSLDKNAINRDNLELTLESQQKQLEDYSITAPISGTVIKKTSKAGDNIGASANASILATIADISSMKFTMEIDELDIAKIKLGQEVSVTADALEDTDFTGSITQIMQEGVSTNGVTVYHVEVTIDKPGELKIGMNVNASVLVEDRRNVIMIPIEALIKQDGNSYVRVAPPQEGDILAGTLDDTPLNTPIIAPSSTPKGMSLNDDISTHDRRSVTDGSGTTTTYSNGTVRVERNSDGTVPVEQNADLYIPRDEFDRDEPSYYDGSAYGDVLSEYGDSPVREYQYNDTPGEESTYNTSAPSATPSGERKPFFTIPKGISVTPSSPSPAPFESHSPQDDIPVVRGQNGQPMPGELRLVVTGVSNRDFIEIISGLNEGERIYIPNVGGSSALMNMMTTNMGNSPMGGNFGGGGGSTTMMIRQ